MKFFSKVGSALSAVNAFFFPGSKEYPKIGAGKMALLGLQHAFAMSCATILVPILTGLDVGVALFAAGLGTILFHLCTRGKMPTFLGSSFAFIVSLQAVLGTGGGAPMYGTKEESIPYALGGIICAGAIYLVLSLLIKLFGSRFMDRLFPPVVRGVGIAIIGLNLASAAINNIQVQYAADGTTIPMFGELTDATGKVIASYSMSAYIWSWIIAAVVLLTAIILSSYGKGMVKMSSIVIALAAGYVLTLVLAKTGLVPDTLMNLGAVAERGWFELPNFVLPKFDLKAIGMIAPIAIVTCVEHVGDVYANGSVVGRDFTKDPGLHRTMLGDGLATMAAGFLGGPPNTTYSENTAVLAATGNYNPASLRLAALIAMVIAFFGKAIGVVETVPNCVLGGACIVLYGMISSVGLRTLVENHVDFTKNRNLCIAAVMFVLAIGGAVIGGSAFSISGIGLGIIAGILLNLLLPEKKEGGAGLIAHGVDDADVKQGVAENPDEDRLAKEKN